MSPCDSRSLLQVRSITETSSRSVTWQVSLGKSFSCMGRELGLNHRKRTWNTRMTGHLTCSVCEKRPVTDALRSDPICRGCDQSDGTVRFHWSQPRWTGSHLLHATQSRWNEVSCDEVGWTLLDDALSATTVTISKKTRKTAALFRTGSQSQTLYRMVTLPIT